MTISVNNSAGSATVVKTVEEVMALTFAAGAVTEAPALAITAGATAQDVFASNAARKYLLFVNNSDEDMHVRIGGTATATTGVLVRANGGSLELSGRFVPSGKVSVYGATTGKAFYAVEG